MPRRRRDYVRAITIGRELLEDEPNNYEFKTHLSIALDDLAGVAKNEGRFEEARQLLGEAEQLFTELVQSDPEHLESQIALCHTQLHFAILERDASRFAMAAGRFRRVRDRLRQLEREGRLEGRRASFMDDRVLAIETTFCEAAPRALLDLDFARSQPPVVAAKLLLLHARSLSEREATSRIGRTAESLSTLTADNPEDLFDLAQSLSSLISDFDAGRWPGLASRERQVLKQHCTDRAVDVLRQAVAHGLRDPGRLESAELNGLSQHPGFRELVGRLNGRVQEPNDRVRTSGSRSAAPLSWPTRGRRGRPWSSWPRSRRRAGRGARPERRSGRRGPGADASRRGRRPG